MSIDLSTRVGSQSTIEGTARNAHAGAVVLTEDRTPVYIDGLDSWSSTGLDGKPIEVTGMLRHRSIAPDPVVDADGAVSHGISGDNYILEQASWKLA